MIPKALVLAFLALQEQYGPSRPFESGDVSAPAVSPVSKWSQHQHHPVDDIEIWNIDRPKAHVASTVEIDFEYIPAGNWDDSIVINGAVRLLAPEATRIWSMPDAFPNIITKYDSKHAWGAFPYGQNITVQMVDGPHRRIGGTFGYVLNGQLAPFSWKVRSYKGGKYVAEISGTSVGDWISLNMVYEADTVEFLATSGNPTGLLLVEDIVYEA